MALGFAVTAAGIQTAISRFVSSELAQNNPAGARLYFRIGLFLSLLLSAATGFVIWKYADFIGVSMLGDVRCIPLLKIISLSFVPCCIHACINGCYYGQKKTGVPALTQAHRADRSCRHGLAALSDPYAGSRPPFRSPSQCGEVMGEVGKHARLRQRRKTSGGNGHGAFREMRHAQSPCHGGSAHGKPGCFNALFQF